MVAFDSSDSLPDSVHGVDIIKRVPYQARRGPVGKMHEARTILQVDVEPLGNVLKAACRCGTPPAVKKPCELDDVDEPC